MSIYYIKIKLSLIKWPKLILKIMNHIKLAPICGHFDTCKGTKNWSMNCFRYDVKHFENNPLRMFGVPVYEADELINMLKVFPRGAYQDGALLKPWPKKKKQKN